jgi:thiol-disulfide isomerase/thioredoxin
MKHGRREALILGAAGLAAAAAGFLVGPALLRQVKTGEGGGGATPGNRALLSVSLTDLAGRTRYFSEWRDRILICNFWATWCAPCREEIPLFIAMRAKYAAAGIEIVGIAVDNPSKVRDFTASLNISYPILLAEADGLDLMRQLGNSGGGLPYTVVTDRSGGVVHRKLGAFKAPDLEAVIAPLTRS